MYMVWHNHEVVQQEVPFRYVRAQYIYEQHCIPFGLQQTLSHAGFGGGKEGARGAERFFRNRIAGRNCHSSSVCRIISKNGNGAHDEQVLYQDMTSVMPQMAANNSGFSRCGMVRRRG
jgi:hypothetical protein